MLNLIFPKVCNGCNAKLLQAELVICTICRHKLPMACHHRNDDITMKNIFFGRIPVENATALLHFSKQGIVQQLLHNLKYRRQEEISGFLGKWLGAELAEGRQFRDIDIVLPVPLHKSKKRSRGYNQVSGFGMAIATALKVPYREDLLLRPVKGNTQAFFRRMMRFEQQQLFQIRDDHVLEGKHVLIVDDIVTTGATIEQCANEILKCKNTKVSAATMAIAS